MHVALTNIPEGGLLTGFAMRSDPNEGFLGVSAPLTASARALRLSGLILAPTSRADVLAQRGCCWHSSFSLVLRTFRLNHTCPSIHTLPVLPGLVPVFSARRAELVAPSCFFVLQTFHLEQAGRNAPWSTRRPGGACTWQRLDWSRQPLCEARHAIHCSGHA